MNLFATYHSPVGALTLMGDGENITGLWTERRKYPAAGLPDVAADIETVPEFAAVRDWLDRYFAGEKPSAAELPLAPAGSGFRRLVWQLLCEIPFGEVTTYGELAKRAANILGKEKMSAQAIGGAVGHNPISIIIPCHRVVGADGSLTGYAGGIEVKRLLLRHEGVDMTRLYVPKKGSAL